MQYQPCIVGYLCKRLFKHICDLIQIRVVTQCVGHNFAVEKINDWRKIKLDTKQRKLSHVCDPFLIWLVCFEITFQ